MIFSSIQFGLGVFLFFSGSFLLSAQTTTTGSRAINLNLSEVAMLDIEPNTSIVSFSFVVPSEAGRSLIIPTVNATKWLNYTSAVKGVTRRTVKAQIDPPFPGLLIKLEAAAASGSGGGTLGTSTGITTLSSSPTTIISGIGGAFTGMGSSNGHLLTISLEVDDYAKLVKTTSKIITITYTFSD